MNEDLKHQIAATQALVGQMNQALSQIHTAMQTIAAAEQNMVKLAAGSHEMSYLVLRTVAEMSPEFRTLLIRFAQESADDPVKQEQRNMLLQALADHHRTAGDRPALKPVPKEPAP